jgi:hypothetical protein
MYYCDIQLGCKLLKAGIKYLSIDELVFGKNYLSPSIYIALASSLLHFFLNVLQEENNNIFKLIAFIGSLLLRFGFAKRTCLCKNCKSTKNTGRGFGLWRTQLIDSCKLANQKIKEN